MLKKVRIHIKTERVESRTTLFPAAATEPRQAPDDTEPERLEMTVEGVLREDATHVYLSYKEGDLTEMGDTTTTISYQKDTPKLVSITRNGAVKSTLVFEEKTRHITVYETPFMPFEIATYAKRVENDLLSTGKLHMNYSVQIKGANAEQTDITLTLLPYFREPIGKRIISK